jgi:uncharacterized damage-inducible protein DinB
MAMPQMPNPKEQFLDQFQREAATTLRVLRSLPANHTDLRPHAMCKTAKELAWMFTMEQGLCQAALTTGLDWSNPMAGPQIPGSYDDVVAAFDQAQARLTELVRGLPDEKLGGTVKFFTAPKTVGDIPTMQFLWMMLCDQIHHRGQFSIYLRMAGGKVPSIYGPTADEPWN